MPSTVNIQKPALLDRLKTNREKHVEAVRLAQEEYLKEAIAQMKKNLEDAMAGKRLRTTIRLVQPQNMTHEYDVAIEMVQQEVGETITISDREFRNLWLDEWPWAQQFWNANKAYLSNVGYAIPKQFDTPEEE